MRQITSIAGINILKIGSNNSFSFHFLFFFLSHQTFFMNYLLTDLFHCTALDPDALLDKQLNTSPLCYVTPVSGESVKNRNHYFTGGGGLGTWQLHNI